MLAKYKPLDHYVKVEIGIKDGKLFLPVQSDVEHLAIHILGSHKNIFFDPIPLTDFLYLKWNEDLRGWEVCQHAEKDVKKKEMGETVIIPAKEIRELIESHIMNEFKTDKFKWVMKKNDNDYQLVGDVEIKLEI